MQIRHLEHAPHRRNFRRVETGDIGKGRRAAVTEHSRHVRDVARVKLRGVEHGPSVRSLEHGLHVRRAGRLQTSQLDIVHLGGLGEHPACVVREVNVRGVGPPDRLIVRLIGRRRTGRGRHILQMDQFDEDPVVGASVVDPSPLGEQFLVDRNGRSRVSSFRNVGPGLLNGLVHLFLGGNVSVRVLLKSIDIYRVGIGTLLDPELILYKTALGPEGVLVDDRVVDV